jgi:hypothetical protein
MKMTQSEDVKTQGYSADIGVNVSTHETFEKIGRVSEWWTKNVTGHSARLGDIFTVRFGETFVDFEISELLLDKKVVWKVTDCNLHFIQDKKEWKGTSVVWEILPGREKTIVRMTHRGLVPGIDCYDNCIAGWNFYVGDSLLKLLLQDKGLPDGKGRQSAAKMATVPAESES